MDTDRTPESPGAERLARREFHLFAGTVNGPRVVVVSTVRRFRNLARELVRPGDSVLEIGCSTGETTRVLARTAGQVLAVDISAEFTQRAAAELSALANVTVRRIDGRQVPSLARLMPRPDLIFLDIGGNAQVDNAAFIVRQCLLVFTPRTLVVRNTELAAMLSLVERVEIPLPEDWPFAPMATGDEARMQLENLLALSRSDHAGTREYAARRLRFYSEPGARKRLEELAQDSSPRVRRIARTSLERLSAELPDGPAPQSPSG